MDNTGIKQKSAVQWAGVGMEEMSDWEAILYSVSVDRSLIISPQMMIYGLLDCAKGRSKEVRRKKQVEVCWQRGATEGLFR